MTQTREEPKMSKKQPEPPPPAPDVKPEPPKEQPPRALSNVELHALTALALGVDVGHVEGKPVLLRLAELGLVEQKWGATWLLTDIGRIVVDSPAGEPAEV